jgi:hypothetical protein
MLEYFEDIWISTGCRMNKTRFRRESFLLQKLIRCCAGSRGVPLFFGCSRPQAHAPVTRYGLTIVFGHLGHHRLVLDFRVLDSGVVGSALLALGRVVMDT